MDHNAAALRGGMRTQALFKVSEHTWEGEKSGYRRRGIRFDFRHFSMLPRRCVMYLAEFETIEHFGGWVPCFAGDERDEVVLEDTWGCNRRLSSRAGSVL